jgi:hypothetical protein
MRKAVELLERAQDEHERVRYASDADRSEAASEIVRGAHGLHTLYLLANVRDEAIATRRRDLLEQAHRLYKHDTNDEHRQVLESVGYTEPGVMLAIGIAEVELGRVDRASSAIRSAVSDAEHKAKIVRELVRSVDRVGRTHWGRVSESVATEIEDPMLFLVFRAEAVRSVPEDDRDEAWENEATWLSDTLQSASSNPDVEAERRNLWLRAGRALEATYHEWTNRSKGETRKSAEPGQGAHHE